MGEIWKAERGLPRCQKKSVAPATKGGGGGGSKDGSSKSWDRNFFVGILLLRGCAREFEKAARDRRPYKSGLAYLLAFSERKKSSAPFKSADQAVREKNFFPAEYFWERRVRQALFWSGRRNPTRPAALLLTTDSPCSLWTKFSHNCRFPDKNFHLK